jgi:release factor glutamine methyltransferase
MIAELSEKLLPVCQTKEAAQAESMWMLEKITDKKEAELLREEEISLSDDQEKILDKFIVERVENKKPLQYILGETPFCGLKIVVEPPVLIPRPETEEWTDWLINKLEPVKDKNLKILDIGSGSGCIALALAKALPNSKIIGIDIHPDAIALGEKNKSLNKIDNVKFVQSDLYKNLVGEKFDLIVSNPPYVSEKDFENLSPEVTKWEDKSALVANDDGFAIHKKIIENAKNFLNEESVLKKENLFQVLIEFGKGQEIELEKICKNYRFENFKFHKDLQDVYRWLTIK